MVSKEEARQKVASLVQEFERDPRKDKLTEEETKEYIKALFEALGWNTRTDMRMEEQISRKFVDYGFRLNDLPVLYLEAKKSSVSIQEPQFVEQAIDYAWHKATTWAVLTNFKELRIFNSYIKESTQAAQLRYLYMNEYVTEFDSLWLLSKESFETKLIDKVAEKEGKKAREKGVVKQLFEDLNKWREILAKDIKKEYSSKYSTEEIDEMIQLLLDRLILIRRIEDENLESRRLEEIWNVWTDGGKNLWKSVQKLFREFDESYNSKIFSIHELDKIEIGDQTLKFLPELYQSRDKAIRYNFAFIDADILGNIYEQYLGYLLKTTAKRAIGEESKSKRKEQGIYYTPRYIVDFIVKNTIGKKLKECKTLADVEKIKVLDPACGSGSFLIRAFDEVFSYYSQKGWAEKAFLTTDGHKSFETVKDRIIKNNIYGVDLDSKAVEIAQLNLLLKTTDKKHKLPTLQDNIKSGNSLIDDSGVTKQPFDWNIEFKEIMKNGGFDIIIGNPPYVRNRELNNSEKTFFEKKFRSATGQYDIYQLFFERAIDLLKVGGLLGFITSNKYAISNYGKSIRKLILDNFAIEAIIDVSNIEVFRDASTYLYIVILKKELNSSKRRKNDVTVLKASTENDLLKRDIEKIKQSIFEDSPDYLFELSSNSESNALLKKISKDCHNLGDIAIIKETVHTGNIRDKILLNYKKDNFSKKVLRGKDCQRYYFTWKNYWIDTNRNSIEKAKGNYATIPDESFFIKPKIFLREIAEKITASYDEMGYYSLNKAYVVQTIDDSFHMKYLLGILNSKLMSWYFRKKFETAHVRGGHLQFKKVYTTKIPIKKATSAMQSELIKQVDEIIGLYEKLNAQDEKIMDRSKELNHKILSVNKKIDNFVYQLYSIDENEISIIESETK